MVSRSSLLEACEKAKPKFQNAQKEVSTAKTNEVGLEKNGFLFFGSPLARKGNGKLVFQNLTLHKVAQ